MRHLIAKDMDLDSVENLIIVRPLDSIIQEIVRIKFFEGRQ